MRFRTRTAVIYALVVLAVGVLVLLTGPHAKPATGYIRPTEYEGTQP